MKYTIADLQKDFANDDVCLDYIFNAKYPEAEGYYRIKDRKCYSHKTTKHQIHPLVGTIFEKTSTPLTLWFHAIFLFASSKNGVSAKELQRQLGVTYKCAWRIAYQIRQLMEQDGDMLTGTVEVDETYMGGKHLMKDGRTKKAAIMGMVERDGKVIANHVPNRETHIVLGQIKRNVSTDAVVMSDEYGAYKKLPKLGYESHRVKHGKKVYVRGNTHTNTIEGFWGQFKRSIKGTHHSISKKHLQSYLNEFAFRYNLRASSVPIFEVLLTRV
jgi:transposase-like protein